MRPERFKLRPPLPVANLKEKLCATFQVGGTGVGVGVWDSWRPVCLPEVWHMWMFAPFSLTQDTFLGHFPTEANDL